MLHEMKFPVFLISIVFLSLSAIFVCLPAAGQHDNPYDTLSYENQILRITLLPPGPDNPRNSEGDFIRLRDGRIMFIYTHFTSGADDFARAHLAARFSDDGGRSWSDSSVVVLPNEGAENIMSVSLMRLKNNKIALFYLRKNSDEDCRLYLRTSRNEARTWSDPILCHFDLEGYYVTNNDRVIQLSDGRLIVPSAIHNTPEKKHFENNAEIVCHYSDNNGKKWKRSATVLKSETAVVQEPGIVELMDGRIMMFCRTDQGYQYISFSSDRGSTWSELEPSGIVSPLSPASIERLPSTGDLLMVWNNTRDTKRTPLTVAISRDDGITWEHVRDIETDPDGWYCYTAIDFIGDYVFLAYCAGNRKTGNGLEATRITRLPVSWLYKKD